jgi:hypothetical protein
LTGFNRPVKEWVASRPIGTNTVGFNLVSSCWIIGRQAKTSSGVGGLNPGVEHRTTKVVEIDGSVLFSSPARDSAFATIRLSPLVSFPVLTSSG